jgi:hypothetical protein
MFKIIRIDVNNNSHVIQKDIANKNDGLKQLADWARSACEVMPNNPRIDVSGIDEISVYIGVNRQLTFRLTDGIRRIHITYDVTTEESVEQGDVAERGWINEDGLEIVPDDFDIDEHGSETAAIVALAVKTICDRGSVEASSSEFHRRIWYTEIDNIIGEQRWSYHLNDCFTEEEEQAIFIGVKLFYKRK